MSAGTVDWCDPAALVAAAQPVIWPSRAGSVATLSSVPAAELASMLWRKAAPMPRGLGKSGVYILFNGNELVYIGQAVNVLARVGQHMGRKEFTHAAYIACSVHELDVLERAMLKLFTPRLNMDRTTQRDRRLAGASVGEASA